MEIPKRSEGKRNKDFGILDIKKEYSGPNKALFTKVCGDINEEFMNLLIEDNIPLHLPSIGIINIKGKKYSYFNKEGELTKRIIDYGKTNKAREETGDDSVIILMDNSHSKGVHYQIYLNRFKSRVKNRNRLYFVPSRAHKRNFAKQLKTNNNYYNDRRDFNISKLLQ